MEWFGVDIAIVLSAEFQALPAEVQANWLRLHAYCAMQENGGTLAGAAKWTDREWRFAAGLTARSVAAMRARGVLHAPWSEDQGGATPSAEVEPGGSQGSSQENLVLRWYDSEGEQKTQATSRIKRKAAEERWRKHADASRGADAQEDPCNARTRRDVRDVRTNDPDSRPDGVLELPIAKAKTPAFDFEALYRLYPRKEGKAKGLQICAREIRRPGDYEALQRAIKSYTAHVAGKDPKYTKHFSSFMACWKDYAAGDVGGQPLPRPTMPGSALGGFTDRGLDLLERDARALGLVDAEGNPT